MNHYDILQAKNQPLKSIILYQSKLMTIILYIHFGKLSTEN